MECIAEMLEWTCLCCPMPGQAPDDTSKMVASSLQEYLLLRALEVAGLCQVRLQMMECLRGWALSAVQKSVLLRVVEAAGLCSCPGRGRALLGQAFDDVAAYIKKVAPRYATVHVKRMGGSA
eukprot:scaffold35629_cov21-Tisochrysis_lutea.AAC.4